MEPIPTKWRKSSYSGNQGGNCVEVSESHREIHMRDTQHRNLGHLSFPVDEWPVFLAGMRAGVL